MADWKDARDSAPWVPTGRSFGTVPSGPFAFTPQGDKWGYLNNPRWHNPARPFVQGGPDDYSGRENEEPQVWEPATQYKQSKGTTITHHQCGHWHLRSEAGGGGGGFPFTAWNSCPEGILPGFDDSNFLYVTTDDGSPIDTFYLLHYDRSLGLWTSLYEEELDVSGGSYQHWIEPDIAVAWKGSIRVIVLIRTFAAYADAYGLDIFVFDGDTLLNHSYINGGTLQPWGKFFIDNAEAHWALIDDLGNIHLFMQTYIGSTYKIRDFISSDNGATFNNGIEIASGVPISGVYHRWIKQLNSGTIYAFRSTNVYTSNNHGATWSGATGIGFDPECIEVLNNVFFAIDEHAPNTVDIKRSTNGTAWATVQANIGLSTLCCGAAFAYDGTYYYSATLFRDSASGLGPGYTRIYRSSDGITWSLLTTIVDEADLGVPVSTNWPTQLIVVGGILYYFFYYGESESDVYPGVYFKDVWTSEDSGVTWSNIETPFYDLTRSGGGSPP